MISDLLGALWRRVPKPLKRWTVRLSHPRFGVTAGAVVSDSQGRVLLLKHRFRPGSGWGLPGGFIEEGEQPDEALRRELREEIGLEVDRPKLYTVRAFKQPKQVEIIFCCQAQGDLEQLNFEIKQVGWFKLDELPNQLPNDQAQLIRRALNDGATPQD